jgi:PAS domain S-box-containing protein
LTLSIDKPAVAKGDSVGPDQLGTDQLTIGGKAETAVLDEQVRILCQTALEPLLLVDDARRYVSVNERAAKLLGVPADALVGTNIEQFTPPDRLPIVERFWAALERDGVLTGRGPLLREDGSQSLVEFRAHWRFAPGLHLIAMREVGAPLVVADGKPVPRLTEREREVLQLAAEGHSTGGIAAALVVSHGTVKTHLQHIYAKLDARDRVSAVATALRLGLIS